MSEADRRQPRDWRVAADKTRELTATRTTRISPSAMAEVVAALDDYWDAIEATDLKENSKAIYMSMADNFVRWLRDEFAPGCRTTIYPLTHFKKSKQIRQPVFDGVDSCRCGHPSEAHLYPSSAQYGDCHNCECELYNPAGGIKGLPIHPLFSFSEDEYRMVSCTVCGRFRVVPDGVCESCGWDNDNNGLVEQTRPQYCRHSPTKQHEIPSLESGRCRYCLRAIHSTPGSHGTRERWEAGCDCNDCRSGMRQWITLHSGLASPLAATLCDLLIFRRNRNEFRLSANALKSYPIRRQLVRLGVLSKRTDEIYVLCVDRLSPL